MFDNLTGLALGIVVFAVVIVIGTVVLGQFGNAVGGTANTTAVYLQTQLGSTSGGLASYAPLIIISVIGFVILGLFLGKAIGKKY